MSEPARKNGTYQVITPPALKARVGAGAGIDASLAQRAHSAVQHLRAEFLQRISRGAHEVSDVASHSEFGTVGGRDFASEIACKFREFESQGGALGFVLVSEVCASLSGYVETCATPQCLESRVVRAHTDALRSVIKSRIDGDGGPLGRALIDSLGELVERSRP